MRRGKPVTLACLLLLLSGAAAGQWQPVRGDRLDQKAQQTIQAFRSKVPRSLPYFEDAYAIAVFPTITRVGFGFGGAYGKGIVVEGDEKVGTTKFWQFTSGIQAGAKAFGMIVFFKDRAALEDYQASRAQFLGQAGIAIGTAGAAGTPAYNAGVAIITLTRLGLMGEFTISGAKFSYRPLPGTTSEAAAE